MTTHDNLVSLLRERAANQPDRAAYVFLSDGEREEARMTWGEIDRAARRIASSLQQAGLRGERILLLYPPGLDYICAFFGCLYAGAVAVPTYPPRRNKSIERLESIVRDAGARAALTVSTVSRGFGPGEFSGLQCIATDELRSESADHWKPPAVDAATLAFLQYTSGSTSAPKGVMVTHGNLLHNERVIRDACGHTADSTFAGWLPLYHDMGLIGNVLQPLFIGALSVLMPPAAFLQRPIRWLEAISRYRAATSGGPDFAYRYCVDRIGPDQCSGLDLSSWTVAFNGAEPVRSDTIKSFSRAFARFGFRRQSFFPCYGLAEATLFVSGGFSPEEPALEEGPPSLEGNAGARGCRAQPVVSCGPTLLDTRVVIADPQTHASLPDEVVGEIWVSGGSVAQGYWDQPGKTQETFRARLASGEGPFLRTGDLGYLRDGHVFVTGRQKDLIIIRGRNYYPQDIERTAETSHPELRPSSGAAFTVEIGSESRLVIVQEALRRRGSETALILERIRTAVAQEHEIPVHAVVLVGPSSIPKTSSGKIQRSACREAYLSGNLNVVGQWAESIHHGGDAGLIDAQSVDAWLTTTLARLLHEEASTLDRTRPLSAYGLDSLRAIELTHQLQRNGLAAPSSAPLQDLSIEEIVAESAPHGATLVAAPDPIGEELVVSLPSGQRALFFLHQVDDESVAWQIARAVRMRSSVDSARLQDSLIRLTERHDILRSTFSVTDGVPMRTIHAQARIAFEEPDARLWSTDLLHERLRAECRRRIDLEQEPGLRVCRFRRSGQDDVLLVILHHAVCDLWTLVMLIRELEALYNGIALPPPSHTYAAYARWQDDLLAGPEGDRLRSYWNGQFASGVSELNLATDYPRPAKQSYQGSTITLALPSDLSQALMTFAEANETTPFVVLLAAYQLLMHRWTGDRDVVTGCPVSGRTRAEFSNVAGYFVNPVAIRTSVDPGQGFLDFLGRVRQTVSGALLHQDYPLPLLVEQVSPHRTAARPPLFQTMFVMQAAHDDSNGSLAALALGVDGRRMDGTLGLQPMALDPGIAQCEILLAVAEIEGQLVSTWQFDTALFREGTIRRMAGHYQALLEGIIREPRALVGNLPLLTPAEHQEIELWNATEQPDPHFQCLHEQVEWQAAHSPEAIAVTFEDETLTYRELNQRANAIALRLAREGVPVDAPVGVVAERSLDLPVALLGVLKAGAAYVPLDPEYPQDRLRFMVASAGIGTVLCQDRFRHVLGDAACLVLPMEGHGMEPNAPPVTLSPDNLAYVIYTSGSTGQPKGAMNTHRGICNRLRWMQHEYGLTADDRVLQKTPFTFDVSVWEFFWPLISGACLVMAVPGGHRDTAYLARTIREQAITTMHFVPSMLSAFLDDPDTRDCCSLRRIIASGEALSRHLQERFFERLRVPLHNLYGPTEASVDVTFWKCRPEEPEAAVPIGHPISNIRIHLLDGNLNRVPAGVPGELYIAGAGLARGYINQPSLTAGRFVPDPFTPVPGGRMYRTGDLARYREDGAIEFLQRVDGQVKIHGFRIEPGEVEAALLRHPAVREACVIAVSDRLAAYVVAPPGEVAKLRDFVAKSLPGYMVPARIVQVDRMPLTSSGKIDRRALPLADPVEHKTAAAAPRTDAERALFEVWTDVLGREPQGIDANFFSSGGDSIRSIRVKAAARARGLDVSLQQILRYQTIRELAAQSSRVPENDALRTTAPFQLVSAEIRDRLPGDVEDAYPLTRLQLGLVFHSDHDPTYEVYVTSISVNGVFDAGKLRSATEAVVRRHPMLRTTFDLTSYHEPLQLVHANVPVEVGLYDLRALDNGEQNQRLNEWRQTMRSLRFEWSSGPLFRFDVHQRDERLFDITLTEPLLDGWSVSQVLTDLLMAYATLQAGGDPDRRDAPAASFADYVALEREALESEEQRRFWLSRLAEVTSSALPERVDQAQDRVGGHIERVDVTISPALSADLHRIAEHLRVPLKSVLLAAHMKVISFLTGRPEAITGILYHGRPETEGGDQVVGLLLTAVPVPFSVDGLTWEELIRSTFNAEQELLQHRRYPLSEIQRQFGRQNLFDNAFNFTHFHAYRQVERITGLKIVDGYASDQTFYDLTAQFNVDHDSPEHHVRLSLDYRSHRFSRSQVESFGGYYAQALAALASNNGAQHTGQCLMPACELQRVLAQSRGPNAPEFRGHCLHKLIEAQAERTPDQIAVELESIQWTFAELNQRANQLAHLLRGQRIGPETRVAVLMRRSPEMVAALTGILKASGAYVPIDPEHPADRILEMIRDSGAKLVLSDKASAGVLDGAGIDTVIIDPDWAAFKDYGSANPENLARPGNLAYVIYTSGSTGKPKGAMNTHEAVCNRLLWMDVALGLEPGDRVLQKTPFTFDVSVWELFWPLIRGGRIVLARPGGQRDASYLAQLIRSREINTVHFVPPMLRAFLEEAPDLLPSLRRVICSGSELSIDLQQRFFAAQSAALYNLYGPTEAAVDVTWWHCQRGGSRTIVPIGEPISNTRLYVLDRWLQPVPAMVPGDLWIGGLAVGRGYAGRPGLTASQFLPDPFGGEPGTRMYRTGDLARKRSDGVIEFLARGDDQVKIRGFRIEPGEIESALHAHASVKECAVVSKRVADREPKLAAFIVSRTGTQSGAKELRAFLAARLPDYMIPSQFVFLPVLPKTTSGKIDRARLSRDALKTDAERLLEQIEQLSEDQAGLLLASD